MEKQNLIHSKIVVALTQDPVYIGTGGYTIGRVDNTIVRDPITNLPKIPGSSLAGTWRYYAVLEALKDIKDKQSSLEENENSLEMSKEEPPSSQKWKQFDGNQVMRIKCAGHDDSPEVTYEEAPKYTGHCGHCIVCKGFGFSKKNLSWQGMLFSSDLNILLFPVFTYRGTRWITTERIINQVYKELFGNDNENINDSNNINVLQA